MEIILQYTAELTNLAAKLEPHRKEKPIINDMFEAADDWKNFGSLLLKDDSWDLTGRMQQEEELHAGLLNFYKDYIKDETDYVRIMELGERLIAACKKRKVDPDGWLGMLKIVRQTFAFLTSEFSLEPGSGSEGSMQYASSRVLVTLDFPDNHGSSCYIKETSDPNFGFALEDLLFMVGVSTSLALPSGQEFTTEADVQAWFTTVADILRRYGSNVLANKPGAFERLAQASAERYRLIDEENDRLYGLGNPGGPSVT